MAGIIGERHRDKDPYQMPIEFILDLSFIDLKLNFGDLEAVFLSLFFRRGK